MPDKICNACIERLATAFAFKKQCQISEHHVRNLFTIKMDNSDNEDPLKSNTITTITELQLPVEKIEANTDSFEFEGVNFEDIIESNASVSSSSDGSDSLSMDDFITLKNNNKKKKKVIKKKPSAYTCKMCGSNFSTFSNLRRHMLIHKDDDRPFRCDVCGSAFTQSGTLKHHMYTHTGEKPYVCSVCDRGFTQSKSLASHMLRHTGEKPYSCENCGLRFRQRDAYKV